MLSTENKHYNTEYQSTDRSYKIPGVTPRKCFCRRCNGKYLTNSNPENSVSVKSSSFSIIKDRLLFKKLLDLFESKDSNKFIKRFLGVNLSFEIWKSFSSYLNIIGLNEYSYLSFVKMLTNSFGLNIIPTKDQINVIIPIIKGFLKLTYVRLLLVFSLYLSQ